VSRHLVSLIKLVCNLDPLLGTSNFIKYNNHKNILGEK
jgi:hypothetical protein